MALTYLYTSYIILLPTYFVCKSNYGQFADGLKLRCIRCVINKVKGTERELRWMKIIKTCNET